MMPQTEGQILLAIFDGLAAAQVVQATGCSLEGALGAVQTQRRGLMSSEQVTAAGAAEIVILSIQAIHERMARVDDD